MKSKNDMKNRPKWKENWWDTWTEWIKVTDDLKESGWDLSKIRIVCEDGRKD